VRWIGWKTRFLLSFDLPPAAAAAAELAE